MMPHAPHYTPDGSLRCCGEDMEHHADQPFVWWCVGTQRPWGVWSVGELRALGVVPPPVGPAVDCPTCGRPTVPSVQPRGGQWCQACRQDAGGSV